MRVLNFNDEKVWVLKNEFKDNYGFTVRLQKKKKLILLYTKLLKKY